MAYTTINKSSDYFDTKLHNGNATAKTLAYDFEVDMFWTKMRNDAYPHNLFDVVRGNNQRLRTNQTNADGVAGNTVSFGNSSGISLGTDSGNYGTNKTQTDGGSQATYVGWGWKAGGSSTTTPTGGTITTTVSANTTAGFSIFTYTGNGNAAHLAHGLGVAPDVVLIKGRTNTDNWFMKHKSLNANQYIYLNDTGAVASGANVWSNTNPDATKIYVGTDGGVNGNGTTYVGYAFAEKTGYSKFGSYTGNGNADGTFVYTGFKPAFILMKRTDTGNSYDDWFIFDNKRDGFNPNNKKIAPNESSAESSDTGLFDLLSNGFKLRTNNSNNNGSGGNFIYMAFAEAPLVGTNNVPCTAR